MKYPLYKAKVNTTDYDTGVHRVSLVEQPATETPWVTFSKDERPQHFRIENEEKRMVRGVIMLADTPIYRRNPETNFEYYLTFDRETLRTMAQKMLRFGYQNNLNTDHDQSTWVEGMYMTEIFQTGDGISVDGFDVPDGTLMATYHVDSDDLWKAIKDGSWSGFSLEGFFNIEEVDEENDAEMDEVLALLDKLKNKINK